MPEVPAGHRYTVEPLRPRSRRRREAQPVQQRQRGSDSWVEWLLLGWLLGGS